MTRLKKEKNDHVSHTSFLNHINKWREESELLVNVNDAKCKMTHADNCGSQFECRHNFARLRSNSSSSVV